MKKLFYFVFATGLLAVGCNKDDDNAAIAPAANVAKGVVNFDIVNNNGKALEGQNMILTNESQNASIYRWDFGTGAISTEKNPQYTFPSCGPHTITLTIKDLAGNTETLSKQIIVVCTKPAHNPNAGVGGSRN